ncbi:hypothetical protein SAMN04489742_3582 [Arthrobacter crystallopoietes]|uniref:Uncharacterized protein n=1 Tax=Crystallibacter crystallopoietes TaxID=37928 RepID=A0A1H1FPR3_9MICC|nr:hypothetical protein AC20117_21445 [Arthrobacter crystallopoietes]SDR03053.1 hypothetical protein SAMN04489742_3582 [Arthrobacter crystallopoietes]
MVLPLIRPKAVAETGWHARLCSLAAFVAIAAHFWMAWAHRDSWWQAGVMLAMAVACLPCALVLWRAAGVRPAKMMMLAALTMAAFHAVLLLAPNGGVSHGHHAGAAALAPAATAAGAGTGGMLVLISWEIVTGMLAATWLRRRRETLNYSRAEAPMVDRCGASPT